MCFKSVFTKHLQLQLRFKLIKIIQFQTVRGNELKEWPGSIVNETLKKRNFYANFKYLSFNNSVFVIKSYNPEKICPILEKGETPPKRNRILTKIIPSHSAYQRTLF